MSWFFCCGVLQTALGNAGDFEKLFSMFGSFKDSLKNKSRVSREELTCIACCHVFYPLIYNNKLEYAYFGVHRFSLIFSETFKINVCIPLLLLIQQSSGIFGASSEGMYRRCRDPLLIGTLECSSIFLLMLLCQQTLIHVDVYLLGFHSWWEICWKRNRSDPGW